MPATQQGGVTQADIFGHNSADDMWDEIEDEPVDEFEILLVKP